MTTRYPLGTSTKGWVEHSVLKHMPTYEEFKTIYSHNKVLMWSGGVCSTALGLLMMDAGEEFDVCHVSYRWDEETNLRIPQQLDWQEKMIQVFKDYGCDYWQFDNPYTAYDMSMKPIVKKDIPRENSCLIGEPRGAFLFQQDLNKPRCKYFIEQRKVVGKVANRFRRWFKDVYIATLLNERDVTKTHRSVSDANRVLPFCLYGVDYYDCEDIILNHGYTLPPLNRCICCPYFDKSERDELTELVPNIREMVKKTLTSNPHWIEDNVAIRNGWYADIFGITELDYPKRKNKWFGCNYSDRKLRVRDVRWDYIHPYNHQDLKKIQRQRRKEVMKND